jgi:hypothetical protein
MDGNRHYVAEQYLPRGSSEPSSAGCGDPGGKNGDAERLCVLYMPEDEVCLYVFEAESRDAVIEAGRRVGTPFDRVSAARLVHGNPITQRRTS